MVETLYGFQVPCIALIEATFLNSRNRTSRIVCYWQQWWMCLAGKYRDFTVYLQDLLLKPVVNYSHTFYINHYFYSGVIPKSKSHFKYK